MFMKIKAYLSYCLCGLLAGSVTGLFGAGGGMLLVPALSLLTDTPEDSIFSMSIAMILPIAITALLVGTNPGQLTWNHILPFLSGSILGGFLAGRFHDLIPTVWLHRLLGCLILWGGIRYLC